jgi:uncharacterized protein YggE
MRTFSSPSSSLLYVFLALIGVATTVALTLAGVGLSRAGLVSVLPVTSQQTGITVCGHGKASARPDQAQVQIGVFATAATAEDARSQAAQAMSSVLGALKANGVADADIQTNYFVIQPQYAYTGNIPRQTGYAAANAVTATVRRVDDVGKIVDAVTAAGRNNVIVNGIQFSNGDPAQAQLDAQKNAVADAKRQAEQIASSAGASLGAPISIQVGGCGSSSSPSYSGADKGSAPGVTTPIQPGQLTYTVDVQVVYALS